MKDSREIGTILSLADNVMPSSRYRRFSLVRALIHPFYAIFHDPCSRRCSGARARKVGKEREERALSARDTSPFKDDRVVS